MQDTDNGQMDKFALSAVNDVEQFWQEAYPGSPPGAFRPIRNFASYDSTNPQTRELCGSSPYKNPNAFYCHRDRLIAWDRGQLIPAGQKYFGQMSLPALMAHEYGHAIQRMASSGESAYARHRLRTAGRLLRRHVHPLGGGG